MSLCGRWKGSFNTQEILSGDQGVLEVLGRPGPVLRHHPSSSRCGDQPCRLTGSSCTHSRGQQTEVLSCKVFIQNTCATEQSGHPQLASLDIVQTQELPETFICAPPHASSSPPSPLVTLRPLVLPDLGAMTRSWRSAVTRGSFPGILGSSPPASFCIHGARRNEQIQSFCGVTGLCIHHIWEVLSFSLRDASA